MGDRNFTPFPVLKTERLTLRQLVGSDANEIFALRSDSNVNKYLGRKPSQSIDDTKVFIQTINENIKKNNSIYWAIAFSETDKLIGTICLFDFSEDNLKAEIGYELLPNFQGKGIMREATSKIIDFGIHIIGLNTIEAYTHSENKNSTKLLEKFNFKKHSVDDKNLILFKLLFNRWKREQRTANNWNEKIEKWQLTFQQLNRILTMKFEEYTYWYSKTINQSFHNNRKPRRNDI